MIGVAGSWGPLAGTFKPMTGGIRYWARPGTIRMPPWKVPFTAGDRRTGDVALYLALVATSSRRCCARRAQRFPDAALPGNPGWSTRPCCSC